MLGDTGGKVRVWHKTLIKQEEGITTRMVLTCNYRASSQQQAHHNFLPSTYFKPADCHICHTCHVTT